MASLTLEAVGKTFGSVDVINGVDIKIEAGELVVFVGPSGCGKSTLLRIIAGLEEASRGLLKIDGIVVNEASPKERGVAMVFQNYALYPHKTVFDNMAFTLRIDGMKRADIRTRVEETARVLQMEHLLDRRPSELSGGQRQRVAIGRAIVRKPTLFLFDEPLSNLDADLRGKMRIEIARLHEQLKSTMIYVTHDQVEAMTLADRIVVLNGGNVQQIGTPMELYHHPRNKFVAGFIGSPRMNFLETEVRDSLDDFVGVESNDLGHVVLPLVLPGASIGSKATLGIRPEHLIHTDPLLSDPFDVHLKGKAVVVERLGHKTEIMFETASGANLSAIVDGDDPIQPGDEMSFGFDATRCHLFGPDGDAAQRSRDKM